jgi:hypothetical protein
MQPCSLVAIVAPGSVEAGIGRVQAAVFAEHGLASAAALPPLIPVAFLAEAAPRGFLAAVSRSVSAPWQVRTTQAAWVQEWLYLSVSSDGMWSSVRASALSLAAAEPDPLFPAGEGFFAGCGDATPEQRAAIDPPVPRMSFSSATIALVALSSPRGRDDWWREVTWELQETRPLRGRRKR